MNELRARHDAALAQLSARQSTTHFAHAAVAIFASAICGGAAVKLSLDLEHDWATHLVIPAAVLSALACGYAIVRLVIGRRALSGEVEAFAGLQALRRELKLDEPPLAITSGS